MNTVPIDGLTKITSTLRGAGMRKSAEASTSSDTTDLSALTPASGSPQESVSASSTSDATVSAVVSSSAESSDASTTSDAIASSQKATAESTKEAKEKLQQTLDEYAKKTTALEFSIEEDTGTVLVKVLDKETGKVIRQMPPDELIALQEQMDKTRGTLFNSTT